MMTKSEKSELVQLIGQNLRKYRDEHKVTQEEIAELCGISTSFYANLERGKKAMSVFVLQDITRTPNISADYLLSDSRTSFRVENIKAILCNMPEKFIIWAEKILRDVSSTFYSEKGSED